jgi:sRNA-binding carbon storage regulator CsrA
VTAPPEVAVHRREIYDMVRAANASAAASDAVPVQSLAARLRSRAGRPISE